ncbi:hypothetical protein EG329_002185 [Mollisiaceae sp. DMI_Dod_QoI]|nr:hypothetical protein EG329_002185 [Helotiales sp. DMI_Dod_QoI]
MASRNPSVTQRYIDTAQSSSGLAEHDTRLCQKTFQELVQSGDILVNRIAQLEEELADCNDGKPSTRRRNYKSNASDALNGVTENELEELNEYISVNGENTSLLIIRIAQLEQTLRAAGVQVPGSPTPSSRKRPRSDDDNDDSSDDDKKDCPTKLSKAQAEIAKLDGRLAASSRRVAHVQEKLHDCDDRVTQRDARIRELEEEINQLNAHTATIQAANDALTAQVAAQGNTPEGERKLWTLLNELNKKLDAIRAENTALTAQVQALNSQVQALTTDRDSLQQQLTESYAQGGDDGSGPASGTGDDNNTDDGASNDDDNVDGSVNNGQNLNNRLDDLEKALKDCEDGQGGNEFLINSLREDLQLARNEGRSLEEMLARIRGTIDDLERQVDDERNETWRVRRRREYREMAARRRPRTRSRSGGREDPAIRQRREWAANEWRTNRFPPPSPVPGDEDESSSDDDEPPNDEDGDESPGDGGELTAAERELLSDEELTSDEDE